MARRQGSPGTSKAKAPPPTCSPAGGQDEQGRFWPTDPGVCRTCGACCAYCRILLNWTEVDDFAPGGVPAAMTVPLGEHVRIMAGTEGPPGRCVALEGRIGHFVTCSIYDRRGSLCREFNPEHDDGSPNEMCDRARRAHGLPPLVRRPRGPARS